MTIEDLHVASDSSAAHESGSPATHTLLTVTPVEGTHSGNDHHHQDKRTAHSKGGDLVVECLECEDSRGANSPQHMADVSVQ